VSYFPRSLAVVLGALAAVSAVIVGTTAATGSVPGATDRPAVGSSNQSPTTSDESRSDQSAADLATSGDFAAAPGSMAAELPAPHAAATDSAVAAAAGVLVAQGSDLRVERVALDDASTVYRVTVSAGPYQMRAMPAILSVDGRALGTAAEAVDLQSLVLYTTDEAVATPGTSLALTYGLPGDAVVVWSTTIEVAQ
jgi:hypothetical protein